ncbi:hypothetical protein [Bacillus pseudomycoides]|uniref:hypothetical protein n=2 Tax=Bacillaceae TaxID=186817 RepID=UPI0020D26435|nr:hypothetical protein [Bacillus pseudomycoides]
MDSQAATLYETGSPFFKRLVRVLRRGHSLESGKQAEEILRNQRADVIAIGRPLLVNPFWSVNASKSLKV